MATDHNFKVKKGLDVLGGDVNLGDGFAYKIDGTTVVDSSRNLTNIGTISSGGITSSSTVTAPTLIAGTYGAGGSSGDGFRINSTDIYGQIDSVDKVHISAVTGHIGVQSGHSIGKFAIMSSGVHNSYDFYNNGTTYLNGSVTIDDALDLTGSSRALKIAGTTRINSVGDGLFTSLYIGSTNIVDTSRNLTNIGTISSGTVTSSGNFVATSGYVNTANQYLNGTIRVLNSAGDGWNDFASRTSAGIFNLASIGTLSTTGNITTSGTITSTGDSNSSFYALQLSRSNTGTTTPDIWGTNGTLVIGTSSTDEVLGMSGSNATFYGNLSVSGNLTISGTTTTVDTANLNVEDNNITINYSTGDSSSTAHGSGITIQDAMAVNHDATILWSTSDDRFNFSDPINVGITGANQEPGNDSLNVAGYGIIGNRSANVYITNSNSSGGVQIGVGGAHNANPKLTVLSSAATFTVPVTSTALTISSSDAQLKFNAEAYKIKGGGYYGDIRIVAPRFRVYEDNESSTAKFEIDGGNATFTGAITTTDGSGSLEISGDNSGNNYFIGSGEFRFRPSGTSINKFVIGSNGNLTTAGTISSGAITSTGNVEGASLETNHTINFGYNSHYLQAGTGSLFFKNSSGASLGGIDASGFNTPYNYQIAGTTVIDGSRNLTNIGTMSNTGKHSSSIGSNATYSRPLLEITSSSTPTQIKITTNILYSGTGASTHAHSVRISGFQYGSAQMADLQIGWHVYQNQFYNRSVTSSGSWAPTVTLAVENNKVVIHLASPGYWPKLYVESMYNAYGGAGQASGWSWTDAAISADSNTPNQTVPYKFDYGNGVLNSAGTTVIDSSRNLTNIGTISSGAITSSGAVSASGALSAGAVSTFSGGTSDYAATFSSSDAYSGIRFQDPDGSGTVYYRGSDDHLYLNSSTFSVGGSTLATNYEFQVNGDANITGGLAINGTTTITSSRELRNLNGNIRSDTNFQFLNSGGSAQNVRTRSVFAGTSYGDTPPAGSVNATNTYELNGTTVINSSGEFVGGLNPSSLDITHSSADSVLRIAHGAANSYDAVIQLSGSAANMATEGAEIWYDNGVGDVHIATTYAHDDAYIRFHTRTGASKSTSNERLTIAGHGTIGINKSTGLDSSYKLDVSGHIKMNNNHIHYVNQLHFNNGTRFLGSSTSTTVLRSATSTASNWIAFQSGSSSATRGYVGGNADSGHSVGLLDQGGNWAVRHINDQGTAFYADNGSEQALIGTDLVSGDYGGMVLKSAKNGWVGYSLNNRSVFMHDNADGTGIYNDVDNEWYAKFVRNGAAYLYDNGHALLRTQAAGLIVNSASGQSTSQIRLETNGTTRGYVYANTSNNIGFLDAGGDWAILHKNDQGTEFRTDGSSVQAAIGADLVGGDYGSMVVKEYRSSWAGYSIDNNWVFMSNTNGSEAGIYNDINNQWAVRATQGQQVNLYYGGNKKLETTTSGVVVTGNIAHDGLTMTSGTDIDQLYTVTDSLTITTSWQNTSINYNDLSTGTYIIQVYVHDHGSGGAHYNEYYSGMMSWYSGTTNSNEFDELALHRAGHAPNDKIIFLRTLRTASNASPNLVLQIRGNYTRTAAANYVFKLRRMI